MFLSHYEIEPMRPRLPNNAQIITRHAETVILIEGLIIHRVLYIYEFSLNILSV